MSVKITASEINNLRQVTGAGMMDCRKALVEAEGDLEKAIDYLRKKGQKVASQRSDRETKEGVVVSKVSGNVGVVLALSCETDFVAKNDDFIEFSKQILDLALQHQPQNVEALKHTKMQDGTLLQDKLNEYVAKIGEKIDVSKYAIHKSEGLASYIHGDNRIGVLVSFNKELKNETLQEAGKDIAMQIAAMQPKAVDRNALSNEVIEREKTIIKEQIEQDPKMAGKPEAIMQNIIQGKLNTFFKENTLLAQPFIKDGGKNVEQFLKDTDATLKILTFERIAVG